MAGDKPRRFRAARTLMARYDEGQVVGLPDSAMVFSNSERKDAWCPRRWWFSRAVGLDPAPGRALRFGAAFDEIMGGILAYYRDHDGQSFPLSGLHRCAGCGMKGCALCQGTGAGPFELVARQMATTPEVYEEDGGLQLELERLERAAEGWLRMYDESMVAEYRVLAVQPMFAVPVTSPRTGQVYRSKVPVVDTAKGWRLAIGHDRPDDVRHVLLPWYQVVKLDAVVQSRRTGKVRTWETKTSSNPENFSEDLLLDTQLPGYTRALWYVTQDLGQFGGALVDGWLWDVTSSAHHRDPKVLKSGDYSLAEGQRVPSWRWERVLQGEQYTRQQAEYEASRLERLQAMAEAEAERLGEAAKLAGRGKAGAPAREVRDRAREAAKAAKTSAQRMRYRAGLLAMPEAAREVVDPKLYVRRWGHFTVEQLREYEVELYAEAVRLARWLRESPGTGSLLWHEDEKVALHWPRVPLCRQPGGHCPYTGVCLQDSHEARENFTRRQPVRWLRTAALQAQHTPEGS